MKIKKAEALALHAMSILDSPTRRAIADYASMSLVSTSSALNSLEEKGFIHHDTRSQDGGGRPTHIFDFSPDLGWFSGVSINPDSYRVVVINADGSITRDDSFSLYLSDDSSAHVDEVVRQISNTVHGIDDAADVDGHQLLGVGITLPGVTDSREGVWVEGFQVTGISHVNIRDLFEQRIGLPVYVEDPARAATFYELRRGLGKGVDNLVLVYLGHGVGAGIVLNSGIYHGSSGLAGEIGHLVVDPSGYRCTCGDVGCLETVASSNGIIRMIADRLESGVVSLMDKDATIDDVFAACKGGDRLARSVIHEVGRHVGSACANLIKLMNPRLLIISGVVAGFNEYFRQEVDVAIRHHVMPSMLEDCRVEYADYELHDEAYGVALVSLENHWERKALEFNRTNLKELAVGNQPAR